MGRDTTKWPLLSPLKRAVKKIKVLLDLNIHSWGVASMVGASSSRRMLSFHDNSSGLRAACLDQEEEEATASGGSYGGLNRTTSFPAEEDVDKKAEMFISNFYRQLRMERQVSLQLRYCAHNSFRLASN